VTDTWTGDGHTRTFPLGCVSDIPIIVSENGECYYVARHDVDTGFRWSYDQNAHALRVDVAQPAPVLGCVIEA
jgi:hypothetical protein